MSTPSVVITGAMIELTTNNQIYKEVANVSFQVDYGEDFIYGVDSPYPQEIATTKISVTGSVESFRIKLSGGLQGKTLRPLFTDVGASPYVSIKITDRSTQEDIIYIPQAKITRESHTIPARGTYKINFDFKGIIGLFILDRS